jgi:hypothetical protein
MAEHKDRKPGWAERRREKKRLKLDRTGDSPEKAARHRTPGEKDPMEIRAPNVGGGGFSGGGGGA